MLVVFGRPPSFYVLTQSCLGWCDQLHIVLLCEEFLLAFVNVFARAGSVRDNMPNISMVCMPSSGMPLGAENSFC